MNVWVSQLNRLQYCFESVLYLSAPETGRDEQELVFVVVVIDCSRLTLFNSYALNPPTPCHLGRVNLPSTVYSTQKSISGKSPIGRAMELASALLMCSGANGVSKREACFPFVSLRFRLLPFALLVRTWHLLMGGFPKISVCARPAGR